MKSTSVYAIIIADVRVVVGRIHVEGFSTWLTSVNYLVPCLPDILNL